jgi:hypothetical protein
MIKTGARENGADLNLPCRRVPFAKKAYAPGIQVSITGTLRVILTERRAVI